MAKRNRNGTVLNLRDHQYPASILNSQMVHPDPAHSWPGAPPEFGVIRPSHISTVQGWIGSQARTYPMEDEATRHSLQNCERMRRDPVIMECLKARQRAVALLPWSLQPEDESDPRQKQLVADLTSILERTYRFTEMRRYLMEAIWYGKAFVHLKYGVKPMRGRWRKVVAGWEPRHSDKILFRYSDGTKDYVAGQIGIRVNMHARDISREQLDATQYGLAYFLRDHERRVCICHKHEIEDGSYQDVFGTGRLHGVGVRDTVYWTWYASKEVEQKLLEYLDRTALGIEIWRYPSGNKEAEAAARKAATERIGGGRSIVLVPVIPGEQAELFGVQHIEPGPAGAELLKTICQEFYGHRIKRLIMGQVLTSEAEATGMGSGVAEAHLATFSDIIRYDAVNLEETLTEELVQIAKEENFPWARSIYIRMKLNTERPETENKLNAYQASWNMGLKIRSEDLYSLIGARRPDDEDDVLQNPNVMMAEQQMAMQQAQAGMMPPGAEDQGQPGDPTQVAMGGAGPAVAAMGAGAPPPGAPAEVSKDSAIEPAALGAGQTPDQQANPWAGFWDSLFAAARGQGVAPPSDAPGPVTQIPMPNGNGNPPVPRGSKEELMRVFQERFDQAIRVRGQTASEFRTALETALAQQPDGDQLATTMQFLFAWKTAEPIGKLKAAFGEAIRGNGNGNGHGTPKGPSELQQALEANLATQLDTRQALATSLAQPAASPVKQAFQDAFDRQTAVREQLIQALQATGMGPEPTVEQNAAQLAPEQAVERYETNQWTDAQLEAYALGRSHALGPDQYAKRKDSPGQRSLFGDDEPSTSPSGRHDVSHEARDESGQWTATGGKSEESPARTGDNAPNVATIGQEETTSQPTRGSQPMNVKTKSGASVTLTPQHYGVEFASGDVKGTIYAWDEQAGGAKALGPMSRRVLLTITRQDYDAAMAEHQRLKDAKDTEQAARSSPPRGEDHDLMAQIDRIAGGRTKMRPSRSPDPMGGLSEQQAVDAMLGEPVYDDPSYGPKSPTAPPPSVPEQRPTRTFPDAMPRQDFLNAVEKAVHDPKFKTVDEIFGVQSPSGDALKSMNAAIRRSPSFALKIPYERADVRAKAKQLGAKWDSLGKSWMFSDKNTYEEVKSLLEQPITTVEEAQAVATALQKKVKQEAKGTRDRIAKEKARAIDEAH